MVTTKYYRCRSCGKIIDIPFVMCNDCCKKWDSTSTDMVQIIDEVLRSHSHEEINSALVSKISKEVTSLAIPRIREVLNSSTLTFEVVFELGSDNSLHAHPELPAPELVGSVDIDLNGFAEQLKDMLGDCDDFDN